MFQFSALASPRDIDTWNTRRAEASYEFYRDLVLISTIALGVFIIFNELGNHVGALRGRIHLPEFDENENPILERFIRY